MNFSQKKRNILQLLLSLSLVFLIAQLLNLFYFRIDLTTEKRYTLSQNTREFLQNIEGDLYFQIFLDGDLPPGFNKLKRATLEMLDEFNKYARGLIHYEMINPMAEGSPKEREKIVRMMYDRGIQPTNLKEKDGEGGLKQKMIFPGLILHDWERETSLNLLKNISGLSAEVNLNNSVEALEYELVSAIRRLKNTQPSRVAFLTGEGELDEYQVADFTASLSQYYQVDRITANELESDLKRYRVVIVAQPSYDFTQKAKYALDQFLMNGGRLLWLIDEVVASMDSLTQKETTIAFYRPLNLEDQLFRYGVRLNPDLIMDAQCLLVPVMTSQPGEPARYTPGPWYYSPLLIPPASHPITRNLNLVKAEFANSIDTVGADSRISKSVLLSSSPLTKLVRVPAPVSLDVMRNQLSSSYFNSGARPVAVLLEGIFTSVFRNRRLTSLDLSDFKEESLNTKMIVISDGDMIRNRVRGVGANRQIEALGYDRYSRQTYGNRKFLLNCIDYLCDDEGWMQLRTRELKLRLLDKSRIRQERFMWQLLNVLIPIGVLLVSGFLVFFFRKRKYATKENLI